MANNISRANRIKRSPGDAFVQVLLYVFVALFAIATVIPFLYVLAGSFATEQELTENPSSCSRQYFLPMHILTL